jgi:hypothetical protein
LVLFGGLGSAGEGYNNDLWEYSLDLQQWRFLGGDSYVYGNISFGGPVVYPGPINLATAVADAVNDTFWLLHGYGKKSEDAYRTSHLF